MIPPDEAQPSSPDRPTTKTSTQAISRKGKWMGAVVAMVVLAGLAGLTWYLTRPAAPVAAAGGFGGQGGPGPGGGGRGGASTVGVATAERASIAVTLDALGTVTPLATARVRP